MAHIQTAIGEILFRNQWTQHLPMADITLYVCVCVLPGPLREALSVMAYRETEWGHHRWVNSLKLTRVDTHAHIHTCTHVLSNTRAVMPLTHTCYPFLSHTRIHTWMRITMPSPLLCSIDYSVPDRVPYGVCACHCQRTIYMRVHLFACVHVNHSQTETGRKERRNTATSRLISNNVTLYWSPQVYSIWSNSPPREGWGQIQLGNCESKAYVSHKYLEKSDTFCQGVFSSFLKTGYTWWHHGDT